MNSNVMIKGTPLCMKYIIQKLPHKLDVVDRMCYHEFGACRILIFVAIRCILRQRRPYELKCLLNS
jgi:hypothetical protein